jgi:hypothetical protein
MPERNEQFTIKCPLCQKEHSYSVKVESSLIMAMLSPRASTQPREKCYTRLFTCPVESKQFQAQLTLSENILERINDVTVESLVADEQSD